MISQKNLNDYHIFYEIRKELTRLKFQYEKNYDYLSSINFDFPLIKDKNINRLMKFIKILKNFNEIQSFSIKIKSLQISQKKIVDLLEEIMNLKVLKTLKISLNKSGLKREIIGYFTKYLIINLRNIEILDLNFKGNEFSDDGIYIFSLGIVNLKNLTKLNLNFSNIKMQGTGLINLIKNMSNLKNLQSFYLKCKNINFDSNNQIFQKNYKIILKQFKKLSELTEINLDFSKNVLNPNNLLSTMKLFLKNIYFSKLIKLTLKLNDNCKLGDWQKENEQIMKLMKKTLYSKVLNNLTLNLSGNNMDDDHFKFLQHLLNRYIGLISIKLNFSKNLFRHFLCNFFSVFSIFSNNYELVSFELNLITNEAQLMNNYSYSAKTFPIISSLKNLKIKSLVPKINKIDYEIRVFLSKFPNLENLRLFFPFSFNSDNFMQIPIGIENLFNLKYLNINLNNNILTINEVNNLISSLSKLQYLNNLRIALMKNYIIFKLCLDLFLNMIEEMKNLQYLTLFTDKKYVKNQLRKIEFLSKEHVKTIGLKCLKKKNFIKFETNYDKINIICKSKFLLINIARVIKLRLRGPLKRMIILKEILSFLI